MRKHRLRATVGVLSLAVCCVSVGAESGKNEDAEKKPVQVARSSEKTPARTLVGVEGKAAESKSVGTSQPNPNKLTPNPRKPKLVFSEGHKATSLKRVGDQIDNVAVTDIAGSNHKLKELLSDRFTVVVFWNEKSIAGMEQFRRIPVDILGTFAIHRVKVIAVNVGGTVAQTRNLTGDAADKIVSLVDGDSKLFKQLATSHIPRTYLLDKDGEILWFDIEYSQSSRRNLTNALTYFLTNR